MHTWPTPRFSTLLIALVAFTSAAFATPVVYNGKSMLIGSYSTLVVDSTNVMTPEQAFLAVTARAGKGNIINLGFQNYPVWIKFGIAGPTSDPMVLSVDNPVLESVKLYKIDSTGKPNLVADVGASKPFWQRPRVNTGFIFNLDLAPTGATEYLLRVESDEQMMVPVILMSEKQLADNTRVRDFLIGLYCGVIIVMFLYNLFLAFSTKDRSSFLYSAFIIAIGLAQFVLSGYAYKYLFPGNPWLYNQLYTGSGALAGIFALLFVRDFLHTPSKMPMLDKAVVTAAFGYAGIIALRLLGLDATSSRATDVMGLVATIVIYAAVIKSMRTGYRPATYFFIAWSIFLVGTVFFILRNLGALPYNNITNYTMQAGTALEVLLLAMALADKINTLKREKDDSQRAALEAAYKNERLIIEQNLVLEERVMTRTRDLSTAKENLEAALDDLKNTQTKLVEQEKMASLGQLTAGIAHEINNPINFVTSNITPLRRDIADVFGLVEEVEQQAVSDTAVDARRQAIATAKSAVDFDYLKEEVTILLEGIQEGSQRTAEIVRGLRVFSRLDESDLKQADINQGMDATLTIVNNLLTGKLKVEKCYQKLPMIECYAGQLNQVWLNLLTNSIHAVKERWGEREGGCIRIETRVSGDESAVEVIVSDNGSGMTEQTKHKLFEPFYTTKDVGEGTGLGLSIVHNTIQRHHGTIDLQSDLGGGTTFTITLPVNQPV